MNDKAWLTDNGEEMCIHVMKGAGEKREYMAVTLTFKNVMQLTASLLDLVRRNIDARNR